MRFITCLSLSLSLVLTGGHAVEATGLIAGPEAVVASGSLTDQELDAVRARLSMIVEPAEAGSLATGLRELARRESRFAIPAAEGMAGRRLTSGVAQFQISSNRLDNRLKSLGLGVRSQRFPSAPATMTMQLSARDLDDGRFIHSGDNLPTGTLTITAQNSQVREWRRFNVARSTVGNYPLTVPLTSMAKVQTSAAVPMGGLGFDTAEEYEVAQKPNVRDPAVAWGLYCQALEGSEQTWTSAQVVWTTMPLAASRNTLRNVFNAQVRSAAIANARPLLDLAAIQSVGEDGRAAIDAEGPCSQAAYATSGSQSRMSLEGAVRGARAWWWLQAQLAQRAPASAASSQAAK